jgi:RNA polymerase sigma-70 factor (ECF subfamily)
VYPGADETLEKLCCQYWQPLYVYIRRHGYDIADAEDLTQSFISSFMKPGILARLESSKGRFQSVLLVSLKNFLTNEWNRSKAKKRGGGRRCISLEDISTEERYCATAPGLSPDALYDRRWATGVLEKAVAILKQAEVKAGRGAKFKRLQTYLTDEGKHYTAVAAELGMPSEAAVAMAVRRLRQRFRNALRTVIALTVAPGQVEEELRNLIAALHQH